MSERLSNETAVVTGAARGIGRAIALRLAGEGARVLAVDINADGLAETARLAAAGPREIATAVEDVARDEGPEQIIARALAQLGSIRLLVNNAGIGGWLATRYREGLDNLTQAPPQ